MSKLARKSVRARKKNPKKFQEHMEKIASKGRAEPLEEKGMGQVWQLDPFDLRGEPSATSLPRPFHIATSSLFAKRKITLCCSKGIMSGVNSNVIMSGWGNGHHPDNATTKADRDHRESLKARSNGDRSSDGIGR